MTGLGIAVNFEIIFGQINLLKCFHSTTPRANLLLSVSKLTIVKASHSVRDEINLN